MRDMTEAELSSWYDHNAWPCGHGNRYLPGPTGGMMMNITCPTCGMRMNVNDPAGMVTFRTGEILFEPPGYKQPEVDNRSLLKIFFDAVKPPASELSLWEKFKNLFRWVP